MFDTFVPSVLALIDGKGKWLATKNYEGSTFNNNFKFFTMVQLFIDKIPDV